MVWGYSSCPERKSMRPLGFLSAMALLLAASVSSPLLAQETGSASPHSRCIPLNQHLHAPSEDGTQSLVVRYFGNCERGTFELTSTWAGTGGGKTVYGSWWWGGPSTFCYRIETGNSGVQKPECKSNGHLN